MAVTNAQQVVEQPDPCKSKSRLVGDVEYCDRYWECEDREPVLYDCPNGLVWVGKDRGIADGCDYPWRNPTLCRNKDLASKLSKCLVYVKLYALDEPKGKVISD